MTEKEQKRAKVLNEVLSGRMLQRQAAQLLGVSERQLRRILAAYREEGVASLPHGNRGRAAHNQTQEAHRDRVVALANGKYKGFNHTHLTEKLVAVEGLELSRPTVRRILLEEGVRSPRKRRAPKHRSRRERYCQEGMLLQIDASPHAWLEGRGPKLTLFAAIDDATGQVPAAVFRQREDAAGYMELMWQVVLTQGRPLAVYHDRHTIFGGKVRQLKLEEPEPSQFGRLLEELEIESIQARSPQAKGRIERLFGTFQDRLVSELRLASASSLDEANRVLAEFLPSYNTRFAVPAEIEGSVYRPLAPDTDPQRLFCFKYERTVGTDNTVRLGEHRLQLMPGKYRRSFARAKVEVHERLDGSIGVYHQGELLTSQPAPFEAPLMRARSGRLAGASAAQQPAATPAASEPLASSVPKQPYKPAADHPWKRGYKPSSGRVVDIPGGKSVGSPPS